MQYLDTIDEKRRRKSEKIQAEYVGAKIAAVLVEHTKKIGKSDEELAGRLSEALSAIEKWCEEAPTVFDSKEELSDLKRAVEQVVTAINSQPRPEPQPAPIIEVETSALDTSKVEELLRDILDRLSLEKPTTDAAEPLIYYTAQELDDAPDGNQYIGFMSLSGNWYIMRHDTETNRNTYYFGKEEYNAAWDTKYSHEYKPLSEAR